MTRNGHNSRRTIVFRHLPKWTNFDHTILSIGFCPMLTGGYSEAPAFGSSRSAACCYPYFNLLYDLIILMERSQIENSRNHS